MATKTELLANEVVARAMALYRAVRKRDALGAELLRSGQYPKPLAFGDKPDALTQSYLDEEAATGELLSICGLFQEHLDKEAKIG